MFKDYFKTLFNWSALPLFRGFKRESKIHIKTINTFVYCKYKPGAKNLHTECNLKHFLAYEMDMIVG